MNKKTIITILLALVTNAGQAQVISRSKRKNSATFFKYVKTFTLGTRFPGFAEGFLCRFP